MGGSTLIAQLALLAWIPVTAFAFYRFRTSVAVAGLMLGGVMLLPEEVGFDFSGLPEFDKHSITTLCAFAGFYMRRRRLVVITPDLRLPLVLFLLLLGGALMTALTNADPLAEADGARLKLYDAISIAAADILSIGLPFFLGNLAFRGSKELRDLITLTALAGVAYSLFTLFESRMSPQLHDWVYGFHQNDFFKSRRLGGWRPMVFMQTGLALAIFMLTTAMACATLMRARLNVGPLPSRLALAYLVAVLATCRSLGTLVYGAASIPIYFMGLRMMARLTMLITIVVVAYPVLRAADLFPTEELIENIQPLNPDRAQSLEFRFDNEDLLLDKAAERPLFGWGAFDRNRVFDPITGRDITITDGYWIIQLGQRGWVGLIGAFGLLLLPIWRACRSFTSIPLSRDRALALGLALMIAVRLIDMLPNGWYTSHPIFFAGALNGALRAMIQKPKEEPEQVDDTEAAERNPASIGALPSPDAV